MAEDQASNVDLDENKFFTHLREIESAERRKDECVSGLRNARKLAQGAGVSLKEFDLIRKLNGFTRDELMSLINRLIQYAKYLRTPVIQQLEMFRPEEASEDEMLDEAYGKGVVAGKRGVETAANPWTLDNPLGQRWEAGRLDGAKLLQAA
ncbi:hypothetical protein [Chelatococcus asaccharovorans]|uniref:Uncharacterized protein n=1 Tax=Chelatococcus asaccharovorans TaxID=28210 RepID=A0A2V3UCC2_9HYPH|nr:hypothetical protein [Chelatococcus asaccharovorans]MBS7703271.1 hypothetical protein [Chelatococcus asaccharovorans]PXW61602.1 hypothetical protein C7450_103119 [Chelatococcus asaccharovorans]